MGSSGKIDIDFIFRKEITLLFSLGLYPKMGGRETEGQQQYWYFVPSMWSRLRHPLPRFSHRHETAGHHGQVGWSSVSRDRWRGLCRVPLLDLRHLRGHHRHADRGTRQGTVAHGESRSSLPSCVLASGSCWSCSWQDDSVARSSAKVPEDTIA